MNTFATTPLPATPLPDGSGNYYRRLHRQDADSRGQHCARAQLDDVRKQGQSVAIRLSRGAGFDRSSLRTGQPAIAGVAGFPIFRCPLFSDVLPTYDVVGFQQLGPPANGNADFTTSVTQFIDNLSWLRGRHSLKIGTDWRLEHLDVLQPPNPTGIFPVHEHLDQQACRATGTPVAGTGNAFASFLLGRSGDSPSTCSKRSSEPRAKIAEFFFQDDFKATRRLTLNLGVRYTLNFPSTVVDDQGAVFNLQTQKLDFLGQNGIPASARNLEKTELCTARRVWPTG